jgi:tetratricopeptide (TPR) repeat protein
MVGLAISVPEDVLADAKGDTVVRQITEALRERDGQDPTQEDIVGALNTSTVRLFKEGKYPEAETVARVALDLGTRVLGAEYPQTLESLNNRAFLYQAQGHYGEAEPLFQQALETRKRMLGAEHPQTLTSLNNLAALTVKVRGRGGARSPRRLHETRKVEWQSEPATLGQAPPGLVPITLRSGFRPAEG